MNTLTLDASDKPDARRIIAWSTTLATHLLAVAVLAIPMAAQVPSPRAIHVAASMLSAPVPPPPPPPELLPEPKPRMQVTPQRAAPIAPPTQAPPIEPVAAPQVDPEPAWSAPPADPAPAAQGPIDAGGATRALAYADPLRLNYPAPAIRARQQGDVLLKVLVDANGIVQQVEIAQGSGYPALDRAAREAVLRARFRPVLRDGVPQVAWGVVPIRFRLDEA